MISEDTICALSTPSGTGAIAVVRLSGDDAIPVCDKVFEFPEKKKRLTDQEANTLHFGRIRNKNGYIDEVVVGIFKSPRSYTGEDVVEISCHGSVYIQQKILETLIDHGARLARPGEFTQRAFLNGKIDLSQAEGVADLIASESEAAHRLAFKQMRGGFSNEISKLRSELLQFISLIELELDFSEEDVEFANRKQLSHLINRIENIIVSLIDSFEYGNVIKNGVPVAIIGPPNAGKSTLLNRFLKEDKAIVSEIAGTTRDFIEDTIVLEGKQFRFIDTAGLRHATDQIEEEGIQRTFKKYRQASIVIVVIDIKDDHRKVETSLQFFRKEDMNKKEFVFALNKSDKLSKTDTRKKSDMYTDSWSDIAHIIDISAKKGINIDKLEKLLVSMTAKSSYGKNEVVVTNVRHFEALRHASEALLRARKGLKESLHVDLLAQDIRQVLHYLGEITGEITNDEILGNIFSKFCIGK